LLTTLQSPPQSLSHCKSEPFQGIYGDKDISGQVDTAGAEEFQDQPYDCARVGSL